MTDQNNLGSLLFLIGSESTSKLRAYSKCRKQVPRSDLAIQLDGPIETGEYKQRIVVRNQVFERVVLRSPVEEIGIRSGSGLRIMRIDGFRLHQPLWMVVGQRT